MRLTGITGPQPGIEPMPLAMKAKAELRVLSTRPPGNPPVLCTFDMYYQFALLRFCKFFSLYSAVYIGSSQSLDA